MRRKRLVVLTLTMLLGASHALADTIHLEAALTNASEIQGSGSGAAHLNFETTTHELNYSVRYTGLDGPATAADIHGPAQLGTAGPIVVHFYVPDSPISGTATLTEEQASALLAGKFYVEIDTSTHPHGELRGQIHR